MKDLFRRVLNRFHDDGWMGKSFQYDIDRIPEDLLAMPLPDELREWIEFLWVEQPDASIFLQSLCPVKYMKTSLFSNPWYELENEKYRSDRISEPRMWKGTRVQLTNGATASGLCVDLCPGPKGVFGQILDFAEGGSAQQVVFNSLSELLEAYVANPRELDITELIPTNWDFHCGLD
jgi:cell wall assembly regulator SMI1